MYVIATINVNVKLYQKSWIKMDDFWSNKKQKFHC